MKARDIMTSPAISVGPETAVKDIAALLYERHISAVAIVEDGRLVGLVSEGDLLHRREIGTDHAARRDSWWLRLFAADRSPAEYIKAHAGRARDVMTREVVTVAPGTSIAEVAGILERERIKRVPVLEDGVLVGIVSRSDLVRALARSAAQPEKALTDEAILARLTAELNREPWWHPISTNITVDDGVVNFAGIFETEEERRASCVAAESIPGVRRVEDGRRYMRYLNSMV